MGFYGLQNCTIQIINFDVPLVARTYRWAARTKIRIATGRRTQDVEGKI
jgi:hypothetical protein